MVNDIVKRQISFTKLTVHEEVIRPLSILLEESQFTPDSRQFWFYKLTVGDSGENILKFSNTGVSCDGSKSEESTRFHLYAGNDGDTSVCVLYCLDGPYIGQVLRIDNGKVSYRKPEVDFFSSTLTFNDVGQDILFEFYRQTISSNNVLYSFRLKHQPSAVLGFTDDGVATTTYSYKSDNSLLMRVQPDLSN